MKPSKWYIVGLGVVHATRFLKFEANVPELMLRPLCMYFGMPLTQLIKQDIANITLTTQGLANIVNKTRDTFLKMDVADLASAQDQVNARLKILALTRDNNTITPIKRDEDVVQLSYSLAGFAEAGEFICQMLSAKTDIPLTELMGKTAQGMNATGEGDRRAWYDRVRRIQTNNKPQYLKMWGIVAGIALQKKFIEFDDFIFAPLEEANEREKTEIAKSNIEMAIALIREVGAKRESVFEWLKAKDDLHLASVELDLMEEGEFPDFDPTDPNDDPFGGISVKNDSFDESKHKRDEGGRFTSGGSEQKEKTASKEKKQKDDVISEFGKSFSEFSGKPEKAIEKLMSEKTGYVPGAIHKDGIGDIDFVYGKGGLTGYGLAHISEKHGAEILDKLPSLIEKGKVDDSQKHLGRSFVYSEDKKIVISLTLFDQKRTWLLTAYTKDK